MKTHKITTLVLLLAIATAGHAQTQPENNRHGFVLGAGIGGGLHFLEEANQGRLSVPNLKIGFMMNPRLGLLVYAPGGMHALEGEERAFEGIFPAVQYWVSEKLYVNAGVGLALETTPFYRVDFSQGPPEFNTGFGCTLSAGQEVFQWSGNKSVDVQMRVLYGNISYPDDVRKNHLAIDVLLGFNLY